MKKKNTDQLGLHKAIVPFGGEEIKRIRIDKGRVK